MKDKGYIFIAFLIVFVIILAFVLCISLGGCQNKNSDSDGVDYVYVEIGNDTYQEYIVTHIKRYDQAYVVITTKDNVEVGLHRVTFLQMCKKWEPTENIKIIRYKGV